jgi:hypothetical protein
MVCCTAGEVMLCCIRGGEEESFDGALAAGGVGVCHLVKWKYIRCMVACTGDTVLRRS